TATTVTVSGTSVGAIPTTAGTVTVTVSVGDRVSKPPLPQRAQEEPVRAYKIAYIIQQLAMGPIPVGANPELHQPETKNWRFRAYTGPSYYDTYSVASCRTLEHISTDPKITPHLAPNEECRCGFYAMKE